MFGGYYVYELGEDAMVISLNGMLPFWENWQDPEDGYLMIDWVEDVLNDNPDKKFLTQTHVFFGNNFFEELEVLWNETYTNQMVQVLKERQDDLIVCLGAHIHHVQIMAPQSSVVDDLNIVQVISPAISPVYDNNPGYGAIEFTKEDHIKSMKFYFFQLEDWLRLGIVNFLEYDLIRYLGVDLNSAQSVRDYVDSLMFN